MASRIDDAAEVLTRPYLRGRLHQLALVASVAGMVVLLAVASTTRARVVAWVYAASCVVLYGASSGYHVFARSPAARRFMQRIDHATIYVLIAGTFTPMAVLAIDDPWRWPALAVMWAGALGGASLKLLIYPRLRRLGAALYIVLGWVGLVAFPALAQRPTVLALVVCGGLLYTIGAILFALRWPPLSPRWFGYHEVWHTFGVTAGVLLFLANFSLIRAG